MTLKERIKSELETLRVKFNQPISVTEVDDYLLIGIGRSSSNLNGGVNMVVRVGTTRVKDEFFMGRVIYATSLQTILSLAKVQSSFFQDLEAIQLIEDLYLEEIKE